MKPSTDSYGYGARTATRNAWSLLVAPTVGALGERREFCPSCGARRMAESAALLVDEVFPHQPVPQWVLSFPFLSGCGPYVFSSPAIR